MAPLNVGIVGVGGIAGVHLACLEKMAAEVKLVGFADICGDVARVASMKYGAKIYTEDYHGLLVDDIDAVLVCVPTHLHPEISIDALRAGKPVFCEKPMARTMEGARSLASAAIETDLPVQFGFVRRFDDEWLAFRKSIQEGKIGRPVVWHDIQSHEGQSVQWFNIDALGGGPFLDGCIHNIDFGLYTFGPVEWVFTHGRTLATDHTAIDTGTATLHFESGDELLLAWSWGIPHGTTGATVFEFLGPKGIITWPEIQQEDSPTRKYHISRGPEEVELVYFPSDALWKGYERQLEEFVEVARGHRSPRAGIQEGLESLRVCLAVLESGRTGQLIRL